MGDKRSFGSDLHAGARPTDDAQREAERFREALARWATSVTIVAAREDDGSVHATTVTSFAPVSAAPPVVVVALGAGAQVLPFAEPGARVGVSLLAEDQKRWASVFTDSFPVASPEWTAGPAPLVPGAVVGLGCTVRAVHVAEGGSRLVVCGVDRIDVGDRRRPLLYWKRSYRSLEPD